MPHSDYMDSGFDPKTFRIRSWSASHGYLPAALSTRMMMMMVWNFFRISGKVKILWLIFPRLFWWCLNKHWKFVTLLKNPRLGTLLCASNVLQNLHVTMFLVICNKPKKFGDLPWNVVYEWQLASKTLFKNFSNWSSIKWYLFRLVVVWVWRFWL